MLNKLRQRFGPATRFLLGLAFLLLLLLLVGGLWGWLPAQPRAILPNSRGPCSKIHISANGRTLVAIHEDSLVAWDVGRRQELGAIPFPGHNAWSRQIQLAPDGQKLALCDKTGVADRVYLWLPATQAEPRRLPDSYGLIGFSGDSQLLIASWQSKDKFYDAATGKERILPGVLDGRIDDIHALADGRIFVSEIQKGWLVDDVWIKVWTLSPDVKLASGPIVIPNVQGNVTVSPDGRLLTAWRMDRSPNVIKLFEARTGRELGSFPSDFSGRGLVPPPRFSADASRLLTDDGAIWDITAVPPRRLGSVDPTSGQRLELSPDGKWLAAGQCVAVSMDWKILDVADLEKPSRWRSEPEFFEEPQFGPDGQTFAAPALRPPSSFSLFIAKWLPVQPPVEARGVKVWRLPSFSESSFFNCESFAYFPDGQSAAVALADGLIEIWDLPPRRPGWIEYGLPVVFTLLVLLGIRHCYRFRTKTGHSANEAASNPISNVVATN